jgi:hypothetical protein
MTLKRFFPTFLIVFLISVPALPQNLEDYITKYNADNGKGYLQPVADAFGASFNSGLFHSAQLKKLGFQAYLGVVTTAAFIPSKSKTFTATTDGEFAPVQSAEVPTVFGPVDPVTVDGNGGTAYVFPGGINAKFIPFAMPQLTIGSLYGTDVTLRYFAYSVNEDVGSVNMFSWGLRHSISQYFPVLPLDIAVGFYSQKFNVGDYFKANAWIADVQASKRILLFTFYGGLGYENSKTTIHYTNEDENTEINYDLTGSNNIRFTAGVTFNLGPVKLNVDYNLASQSILCVGLGVGIGEKGKAVK